MKEELLELITKLSIICTKEIIDNPSTDQQTKRQKILEKDEVVKQIYDLINQIIPNKTS